MCPRLKLCIHAIHYPPFLSRVTYTEIFISIHVRWMPLEGQRSEALYRHFNWRTDVLNATVNNACFVKPPTVSVFLSFATNRRWIKITVLTYKFRWLFPINMPVTGRVWRFATNQFCIYRRHISLRLLLCWSYSFVYIRLSTITYDRTTDSLYQRGISRAATIINRP